MPTGSSLLAKVKQLIVSCSFGWLLLYPKEYTNIQKYSLQK